MEAEAESTALLVAGDKLDDKFALLEAGSGMCGGGEGAVRGGGGLNARGWVGWGGYPPAIRWKGVTAWVSEPRSPAPPLPPPLQWRTSYQP